MFIVKNREGFSILNGEKIKTLRPIKASGKGYFKIGSLQQIRQSRNFKKPYLCMVLVTARYFVNVDSLEPEDFQALGYPSKAEYMAQDYNLRNPSPERVCYEFIGLDTLLRMTNNNFWTYEFFKTLWGYCKLNKHLSEGVTELNETADPEAVKEAIDRLQANIVGWM